MLERKLSRWLDDPGGLSAACQGQASAYGFPEAGLVASLFPLIAWAARFKPASRPGPVTIARMAGFVRAVEAEARSCLDQSGKSLGSLTDYGRQGVQLGLLNMALSTFRFCTGDARFGALHDHVSRLLHAGFERENGGPIWSYPHISWPFDSLFPLLSLHIHDLCEARTCHTAIIRAHLEWLSGGGCEPFTGLPYSMVPMRDAGDQLDFAPPRGGALAMSLCLLWPLDSALAQRFYISFVKHFWRRATIVFGFREWPEGCTDVYDCDSGPVVAALGAAANGFGLACTALMGDVWRHGILQSEMWAGLVGLHSWLRLCRMCNGNAPVCIQNVTLQPGCLTGFLFGDICLFLTLNLPRFLRRLVA